MPTRTVFAAYTDDLVAGKMKAIKIDEQPIILAQIDGSYYAMHGTCTHYGAPLADGLLNGHRVICPWHHACFDLKTGRQLEAPGLDGLPTYPVQVKGNELYVELPDSLNGRSSAPMAKPDPDNQTHYVVIGGGAAGAYAVEAMRQTGFTGKITLISAEKMVPYDRPNCSKEYLSGDAPAEWMPLRDASFYEKHGIHLLVNQSVQQLDAPQRRILLRGGQELTYDKVLIATGGQARRLDLPGGEARNVFALRSIEDSQALQAAVKDDKEVVVVGASFIGMEAAMSLNQLGAKVTVVAPDAVPFEKVFGREVGQLAQQLHESAGTQFRLGRKVTDLLVQGEYVTGVTLDNGDTLPADVVVMGIGVQPATDFLQGLPKASDGGLQTDAYLQVQEGVYAAGDVAHVPYRGHPTRIEHWKVAAQQGRVAGQNMAGQPEAYQAEPFFWSVQPGTAFGYVGHATDPDEVIIEGELSPDSPSFLAYYKKGDEVQAVLAAGRDVELARVQELFFDGKTSWAELQPK